MKIQFFSDAHVDINRIQNPEEFLNTSEKVDFFLDAGDTGSFTATNLFYKNKFWEKKNVNFISGNHLGYDSSITLEKAEEALRNDFFLANNISFLQNSEKKLSKNLSVLGTTLWTDFNVFNTKENNLKKFCMEKCLKSINDYNQIRFNENCFFSPKQSINLFNISMHFLNKKISQNKNKKFIILTHHAPSLKSCSNTYKDNVISSAFCSNLEDFIEKHSNKILIWIHGHMHNTSSYKIKNTYIFCNPLGYKRFNENSGFISNAILDI